MTSTPRPLFGELRCALENHTEVFHPPGTEYSAGRVIQRIVIQVFDGGMWVDFDSAAGVEVRNELQRRMIKRIDQLWSLVVHS